MTAGPVTAASPTAGSAAERHDAGTNDAGTNDAERHDAGMKPVTAVKPLPVWFFAFEGIAASAYDLCKACPSALWVLGALFAVNIVLTLTVLRTRVRLARRLWRSKGTRKIALGLAALRLGSHFALVAAGADIDTVAGHIAFGVVMGAVTVTLLWFTQRTAMRAPAAS
jgi:quinol-cytochrome oxidoreductase complex cytochrome b subunit